MAIKNVCTLKKLEKISGKKLTLGNFLQAIRLGEDKTQAEFALNLGISKQNLCDIENGRRFISPKMAVDFASRLKYSPNQFVRLCLQDLINRDGIKLEVEIKAA